jgi:anti-sigma regulatory factor (Ser/Thr protein kinase)
MLFTETVYESLLHMGVPRETRYVRSARNAVNNVLQPLHSDPSFHDDLLLAFGEACNNAILYGDGESDDQVYVTCRLRRDRTRRAKSIQIEIRNAGAPTWSSLPSHSYSMPDPDDLGGHGRGLPLMRMLTDRVDIYADKGDTVVRLTKHFPVPHCFQRTP